ncbi:MAG: DUF1156 domain-containing protein [Gemmatimonadota bacterium]|nr:DUF1156 domain-containing protein [Gemmatimonadota bacterium]
MSDTRLIERWLPIAELGIESTRERTPMTPFPAPNRLHVWWARRPLVASRAAILASLLPADADREGFLHALGIHGDPVAARNAIEKARRTGVRVKDPYGYDRAFGYSLDQTDTSWLKSNLRNGRSEYTVLDPTAGGGSIPFETIRMGLTSLANDLNPVAALVMRATVEWPSASYPKMKENFEGLAAEWRSRVDDRLTALFPQRHLPERIDVTYLWAHTINCPYCEGVVPLSPNWRLAPDGTGVRLKPNLATDGGAQGRVCSFEIVQSAAHQSSGTVARGAGTCPYADCGRVIDGDEVKTQAQSGHMGEQLYAIVYKRRIVIETKSGKTREKWVREFRAPLPEDDNSTEIQKLLAEKLPEWEALNIVPAEGIPDGSKTSEPLRYGMRRWRDLFSPRQLLCHGTGVEVFRELFYSDMNTGRLNEMRKAAYGYLALSMNKMCDYDSRMTRWHVGRQVMANTFDRHDLSFKWSFAEMGLLIDGLGYDWSIRQTAKCIDELIALVRPETNGTGLFDVVDGKMTPSAVTITCKPGDSLDHIADGSIDAVVIDPPYYANVMYAELSDFFYVWFKRTAGYVFPELFRRNLTDKEGEAVANPAKFEGQKGAKALAGREYQERMASIFAECRRTLKANGIMTLMFTHKETDAWDALTKGLMDAGFAITASWPINTEAQGSLHIKEKAAANSTIFLVCRPRNLNSNETDAEMVREGPTHYSGSAIPVYWEDIEPRVARSVRSRILEFQEAGITGVDLYLASFGPALEEFSRHWPLKRGTPRPIPAERRRRRQLEFFEEEWDPYAATPEDALDAARREVKRWRLEQLTHLKGDEDLDGVTAFIVLAWDAFKAAKFSYDEALRLARAVGVDIDNDIVGRLAEKTGSDILLWDSSRRAAKGTLGPVDGSRAMIDAIHHAANLARIRSLTAAKELLAEALVDRDPRFFASLEAVLEVLPVSRSYSGIDLKGEIAAAADDFEVLYKLSRLAYGDQIDEPEQLKLWQEESI